MFTVVGLGNPGEEYEHTHHNAGRIVLMHVRKTLDFPKWEADPKRTALVSEGSISGERVTLLLPETFMNRSGASVAFLAGRKKPLERLVVVHDDLDLPSGRVKLSFGKRSGGHRGVESVIRSVGSVDFLRVRVGISPATRGGTLKKPRGEKAVTAHILGPLKKPELEALKKLSKKIAAAIETIVTDGREKAMSLINGA